jgi:hypothetical protein
MTTYTREDERVELNRALLNEMLKHHHVMNALLTSAKMANCQGKDMPLIGIETELAVMMESYSVLKNAAPVKRVMREYTEVEVMAYADRESDESLTRALNRDLAHSKALQDRLHMYTWTRDRLLALGKAL